MVLWNEKLKVENGKLFRFFISTPLGEGVRRTGEGYVKTEVQKAGRQANSAE